MHPLTYAQPQVRRAPEQEILLLPLSLPPRPESLENAIFSSNELLFHWIYCHFRANTGTEDDFPSFRPPHAQEQSPVPEGSRRPRLPRVLRQRGGMRERAIPSPPASPAPPAAARSTAASTPAAPSASATDASGRSPCWPALSSTLPSCPSPSDSWPCTCCRRSGTASRPWSRAASSASAPIPPSCSSAS